MSDGSHYIGKTYQDVERYLVEVRRAVRQGDFKIAEREEKNLPFMRRFNITTFRAEEMICSLCPEDFLHAVNSRMEGNEDEELFVFCKSHALCQIMASHPEPVQVYYKFDLIKNTSNKMLIVVSMHVAERPPEYAFQ